MVSKVVMLFYLPFGLDNGEKGGFCIRTLLFNVLSLGWSSALGDGLCEKGHELAIAIRQRGVISLTDAVWKKRRRRMSRAVSEGRQTCCV